MSLEDLESFEKEVAKLVGDYFTEHRQSLADTDKYKLEITCRFGDGAYHTTVNSKQHYRPARTDEMIGGEVSEEDWQVIINLLPNIITTNPKGFQQLKDAVTVLRDNGNIVGVPASNPHLMNNAFMSAGLPYRLAKDNSGFGTYLMKKLY